MQEDFLHFVWQYRLYLPELRTIDGRLLSVIKPGEHNRDAGPDFLNAQLRIGDTLWAGHVEIHVNGSDWARHGHHRDKAYDNVILHVVYADDQRARNSRGEDLPVLSLRGCILPSTMQRYSSLSLRQKDLACSRFLPGLPDLPKLLMLERCAVEKMQARNESLLARYRMLQSDPDTLAYQCLARAMGFKVNADAFQLLVRLLPYAHVRKLRSASLALPAVILGCAGMPGRNWDSRFESAIRREWEYRREAMNLRAMEPHLWRFARTRPANHPDRRLLQFSCMLQNAESLFQDLSKASDLVSMRTALMELASFPHEWEEIGLEARDYQLSSDSLDLLIINVCQPLRVLAGSLGLAGMNGHDVLEELGPENNAITRILERQGIRAKNAWQSQGLLQLYSKYCKMYRCLSCSIAVHILSSANQTDLVNTD